jgi:hemerythrin
MGISWDRSLAVGVNVIDEQHQELFKRVNALLDAMLKQQAKGEIEPILRFLTSYVVEHFGAEERLMARYAYPGAATHKQQHAAFVERFGELKAQYDKSGPTSIVSISLNTFVCGWLRDHIRTTDVALAKHLQAVKAQEAA